jgi:hypothetical protein
MSKVIYVNASQKDYDPEKADGSRERPFDGLDGAYAKIRREALDEVLGRDVSKHWDD